MKALDMEAFDEVVYDDCQPCLIIFSRKTCHVCQAVKPKLAELEEDYGDRFGFYSVDVEEQPQLFARFNTKGVPHVMFFADGAFVRRLSGEKDIEEYEAEIQKILSE